MISLKTVVLAEEVLKSKGWAYQFDLSVLTNQDEDSINEHIQNVYLSAIQAFPNRNQKTLEGTFLSLDLSEEAVRR
ncbi:MULTISPECIES: hypothetical protein [unclassified Paenibacillus]|uniref:hypothetical protein n=1 Tax=unclassified Paenibacillus TaxID=185978 RepID=UPI00237873FB|nr:hypothetical protein [Paenibacillus sp. MAHUQ-63]